MMKTESDQHPVKIVKYTRSLPCPLTTEEQIARGAESARLGAVIESKENELKRHVALAKAAINDLKGRKRQLESEINNGHVLRDVECEEQHIYRLRLVRDVRCDTQEVIAERPMTERELQLEIDTVAAAKLDDEYVARAQDQASAAAEDDPVYRQGLESSEPKPPKLETAKPRRGGGRRKTP
ncbi:MAG: hypothetical protein DIU78_024150 [Pseudomonadota bacterium]